MPRSSNPSRSSSAALISSNKYVFLVAGPRFADDFFARGSSGGMQPSASSALRTCWRVVRLSIASRSIRSSTTGAS